MGAAVAAGKPIDPTRWPDAGPHRDLLQLLAEVHEDNGFKSLRDVAAGMNLASRTRVSCLLRAVDGTLPADENQLAQLVRALGGGDDDVAKATPLYQAAKQQRTGRAAHTSGGPNDRLPSVVNSEPRALGVHAAITTTQGGSSLPPYVDRDADLVLQQLIAEAATKGGFILLVGDSSVGKTRTLYEALRGVVPSWSLWQPADAAEVRRLDHVTPQTVVWLDELQHFLRGGLAAGDLRALRRRHDPLIIVATLWPLRYQQYSVIPPPRSMEDPYQAERELLGQAEVVTIDSQLSVGERDRARVLAASDPRIAQALNSEFGMTQALAAAPALVQRWDHAPERYVWALLTAAIDARRMGIDAPLSADLLRAAVPGYLTPVQQAKAPANWFEEALSYATKDLHGAVAALIPVGIGMGMIAGYTVADYLLQYGAEIRRSVTPPRSAWDAYRRNLMEPADLLAASRAAEVRSLLDHAEDLLRSALRRGSDPDVRPRLAMLLRKLSRLDEAIEVWREAVAAEDPGARLRLALLLQSEGRWDEAIEVWRTAADAGDPDAHLRLALLLRSDRRVDDAIVALRRAVAARVEGARAWLVAVLQDDGHVDDAIKVWQEGVAVNEDGAREGLAALLQSEGRTEEAIKELREAVATGLTSLRPRLAELLHNHGSVEEALAVWREGVRNGEAGARAGLAVMLQFEGRADEAIAIRREAVEWSDRDAIRGLAELLEREGRADEAICAWRTAVRAGVPGARLQLTWLLQQAGRLDDCIALWQEALAANEPNATHWLTLLSHARKAT
ncbi:tetratricopeptide repeat protein [Plantactinospora sp. WMMB334]|uniref:tetratricopeptide repeat protein n=1 Tax=Plantactinospora sp. WMMB334 TaxID=3404119 RepID=UPI003B95E05B